MEIGTTLVVLFSILAQGESTSASKHAAERLAGAALKLKDPEAVLSGCSFASLGSGRVFFCYSENLGPSARCDDGSRSAPFWIIEGSFNADFEPEIGQVVYREACEGAGQ